MGDFNVNQRTDRGANAEIWKEVPGYEFYQVSNLGKIKSFHFGKEKILKNKINKDGYFYVGLSDKGIRKHIRVHQIVAMAFLNHKRCGFKWVVNHINFNKSDNRVENLEIVTNRENCNKKHIESSSKYVGVHWQKNRNKWVAMIQINGFRKNIGRFTNEYDAHLAYQNEFNKLPKKTME